MKNYNGAIPDKVDFRDYRFEFVAGSSPIPNKFSLKDKIVAIKHQGKSSSCVGQAYAYYAEVLNFIETGEKIQLSARDIYSTIHLENGGAYLRDGAQKLVDSGVLLEKDAPSYINGNPPTEAFMRQRNDITEAEIEKGNDFLAKSYLRVPVDFDFIKRAICENSGCVIGLHGTDEDWLGEYVIPPTQWVWGHAIYLCGYDENYIYFVNSWGEGWGNVSFGKFGKEYIKSAFTPWTVQDMSNDYYQNLKRKKSLLLKLKVLYEQLIELLKRQNQLA